MSYSFNPFTGNLDLFKDDGLISVVSSVGKVKVFKPSADTDLARGNALISAKDYASSGDTVVVNAGTYDAANLLKNGVNYYFHPGAIVHCVRADIDAPIFDDGGNDWDVSIGGYGIFIHEGNNTSPGLRQVFNFRGNTNAKLEFWGCDSKLSVAVRLAGTGGSSQVDIYADYIQSSDGTIDNLSDDITVNIHTRRITHYGGSSFGVEQDGGETSVWGALIEAPNGGTPIEWASAGYIKLYNCHVVAATGELAINNGGGTADQLILYDCEISADTTPPIDGVLTIANCYMSDGSEITSTGAITILDRARDDVYVPYTGATANVDIGNFAYRQTQSTSALNYFGNSNIRGMKVTNAIGAGNGGYWTFTATDDLGTMRMETTNGSYIGNSVELRFDLSDERIHVDAPIVVDSSVGGGSNPAIRIETTASAKMNIANVVGDDFYIYFIDGLVAPVYSIWDNSIQQVVHSKNFPPDFVVHFDGWSVEYTFGSGGFEFRGYSLFTNELPIYHETDNILDLGKSANRIKDLHIAGNISDGTNSTTAANLKTAYDHSQDNSQAHSDYLINNGDDTTSGTLTAAGFGVDATLDHTITDSSDELVFTNPNQAKTINFNLNPAGTSFDFLTVGGQYPKLTIDTGGNTVSMLNNSLFDVMGTYTFGTAAALNFQPTITSGAFVGVYFRPVINSQSGAIGIRSDPTFGSNNRNFTLLQFGPGAHTSGFNDSYIRYTESLDTIFFNVTGNVTYDAFKIGSARTVLDFGGGGVTLTETMIALTGGGTQSGTSGSVTQKGLTFSGFGTQSGNVNIRALEANGGLFSFKFDGNGTTSAILLGASEDYAAYFDGTDMLWDRLVGTGAFRIKDDVVIEGDTWWETSGTGLPYGSCYGNEIAWTQASAAQNTWYLISDADIGDGELNLVTHDGNGQLTVNKAGRYLVHYTSSVETNAANKHVQLGLSVNGGNPTYAINHFQVVTINSQVEVSGNAILSLSASDTVEVAMRTTDTGTPSLSVDHLNITIVQVGG